MLRHVLTIFKGTNVDSKAGAKQMDGSVSGTTTVCNTAVTCIHFEQATIHKSLTMSILCNRLQSTILLLRMPINCHE